VKRLFLLVTLAIIPARFILFGVHDTSLSIADTSIPNNQAISNVSKASNSSATAGIRITMTGVLDE
jgi:hypothetical protein